MPRISVEFNQLRQLATTFGTTSSKVDGVRSAFSRTVSQLDWDVRQSGDINNIANRLSRNMERQVKALKDYQNFVNLAHDRYMEADNARFGNVGIGGGFFSAATMLNTTLVGGNAVTGNSSNSLLQGLTGIETGATAVNAALAATLASIFGTTAKATANLGYAMINGVPHVAGIGATTSNAANLISAMHIAGAVAAVTGGAAAAIKGYLAPADSTGQRALNVGVSVGTYAVGLKVGAKVGGAIGSFIPIPVVGTLVGAAVGAGIGIGAAYAGDWLINGGMQTIGNAVSSAATATANAVSSAAVTVANGAVKATTAVVNTVSNVTTAAVKGVSNAVTGTAKAVTGALSRIRL